MKASVVRRRRGRLRRAVATSRRRKDWSSGVSVMVAFGLFKEAYNSRPRRRQEGDVDLMVSAYPWASGFALWQAGIDTYWKPANLCYVRLDDLWRQGVWTISEEAESCPST